tara:strand:- start:378 stop:1613 length:1236 start_codon:yes stop_codon:yes gene_type:complete
VKKLLGIMVLGLLFIDNAYATHFLKTASEVCKINQDIDFDMKWKQEDGSWEVEKISLKKGDHLKMHKHKKKNTKWYVGSDAVFPLKNTDWDIAEVSKKYEGVKIKDIIGECKKINHLNYKSHTADSFNEIFNNKYSSKPVKLSGELYLPKKKGKFPVVYIQHGTGHPKGYINFFQKVIVEMHKENIAVFVGDSYSKREKKLQGWRLGLAARVLDGLVVLNTLSEHKNIDPDNIGITGYSYGGMVAFFTAYPKLLDLVSNGKSFAAYMPVYPGCDIVFKDMKLVKKPMLMLHAELDNYAPTIDCINYVKQLKENGNDIELKIYKGAHHGFIKVQETKVLSDVGNFIQCKSGYVTDEGYWFYNNKEWKNMTELETVNAVWKECGQPGVRIGGTLEQQEQTITDTVNFFKKHLK